MKNKFWFLTKHSIKKKINTKWFKVVNIILILLIVGICNIDRIISFFGGDFEAEKVVYILGEEQASFKQVFENNTFVDPSFKNKKIVLKNEAEKEKLKEDIKETEDIIIDIQKDDKEYLKTEIISFSSLDGLTKQSISSILGSVKTSYVLNQLDLKEKELNGLINPISIKEEVLNPNDGDNASKDILTTSSIVIFIVPFFILVVLLVQMIGAEINDEKTSRSMEIIISSVSPKVHFLSKLVAAISFVLIQALLFLIYGLIGLLVRNLVGSSGTDNLVSSFNQILEFFETTGVLSSLASSIVIIIALLLCNLFAFGVLSGILASMTTSTEDFQQLQAPVMIICVLGYYIAIMSSMFNGSIFIKIFSIIPFFSAMIAPVIYLVGQSSIWMLLSSLLVCIIFSFVLFYYGLRIYKVGILNYSSKDLWKKIFKSIKKDNQL